MTAALLLDLDDTLVVEDAAATAAFRATADVPAAGCGLDAAALAAAARTRARQLWNAAPEHPYCLRIGISSSEGLWCRFEGDGPETRALRAWAPEYRREAWRLALLDQGVDDPGLAEALGERFPAERRARHRTYADAAPALDRLAGEWTLALVTNGAACLQREKLAASGLAGRFAQVVVSEDVGAGKPDPAAFRLVLDRLRPARAVMVGDSLTSDVQGALAAGIEAVWINRDGRAGNAPGVPQIASLAELPALLAP